MTPHKSLKRLCLLITAILPAAGCHAPDYTRHAVSECEIHHVAMFKRAVPIAYGMIPMSRAEGEQGEWHRRMTLYPHPGDCMPATDLNLHGETRARIYVCPRCEAAFKQASK